MLMVLFKDDVWEVLPRVEFLYINGVEFLELNGVAIIPLYKVNINYILKLNYQLGSIEFCEK